MSPINSLWFKWKSLKLPWRKTFLAGKDLAGNTFWEFKDTLNSRRLRRIVKYNPKTHLADVQVSPQWHQWLRYARQDAPTIQEQQNELLRQERIKHLAKLADERWASKPSFLDRPQGQHPDPAIQSSHELHPPPAAQPDKSLGDEEPELKVQGKKTKSPWVRNTGGPSEGWQPESWKPAPKGR
ncbi:NADH ubiquinone oxidoreductase family protein [Histoplasma capsulatum]|uniref:NADH ubiquinone oxidoreductase family protein n=1 Tax=Ajellomyces capsulatus TaxID=5037 RepID=A0A8A1MCJ2_AJECA|nr:predicted protein [Histoplasma mississippiense (nom. inval.)]EDN10577.1 predicted protein [Histoplasma mississippiense (nom. inval.)]QSS64308.1 NADH ubiquinone oxidoreductase family protein [Histoplasma capsulatum]